MENNQLNPYPEIEQPAGRPKFLQVLCILSFIGSGLTFLFAIAGALSGKAMQSERQMEQVFSIYEQAGLTSMIEFMDIQMINSVEMNVINLLFSGISLVGVYMMFSLNKKGFFVYSLANLAVLFYPFMYFGTNPIYLAVFAISLIITTAFIIMYAINSKHMN